MFKKLSSFMMVLAFFSMAPAQLLNPSNGIAFKVADREFSKGKVDTMISLVAYQQGRGQQLPPQAMSQIKYGVVQELIMGELLRLEAKALNIKPSKGIIDTLVQAAKGQFRGDEARFQEYLKKSGLSQKEFQEKVTEQAQVETLMRQVLPGASEPTEVEMKKFFEDNRKLFPVDDSIAGIRILVKASATEAKSSLADKKTFLEGLAAQIKLKKASPAQLAALNSEEEDARQSGGRYINSMSKMPKPFVDAVKNLKTGEVSKVFQTNEGLQIFVLNAKNDGEYKSYEDRIAMNLIMRDEQKRQWELMKYVQGLTSKYKVQYLDPSYEPPVPQETQGDQ